MLLKLKIYAAVDQIQKDIYIKRASFGHPLDQSLFEKYPINRRLTEDQKDATHDMIGVHVGII